MDDVPIWIYLFLAWVGGVVFFQVVVPAIRAHLAICLAIGIGGTLVAVGVWCLAVWWSERIKDRELRAAQKAEKARWEAVYADKRAKGLAQLDRAFAQNQAETAGQAEAARAENAAQDGTASSLDEAA